MSALSLPALLLLSMLGATTAHATRPPAPPSGMPAPPAGVPAPPAGVPAPPASHPTAYADAVQSFRAHRWAAAYGRFARLADRGHRPSAQIALMMFSNGPALFGAEWDATPEQLQRWQALVHEAQWRRAVAEPAMPSS